MAKSLRITDYTCTLLKNNGYTSSDLEKSTYPGGESSDSDSSEDENLLQEDDHEASDVDPDDHSGDDDLGDEESNTDELEVAAKPKNRGSKAVVLSKAAQKEKAGQRQNRTSKGKTTTPATTKSKKPRKTSSVSPESPNVSPISTGFSDNRSKRRQESVNSMVSSAKDQRERSKKRQQELEDDNAETKKELKRLKKQAHELREKLQAAEASPQEPELPVPDSRKSNKKRRSQKEALGKTSSKKGVTLDGFVKNLAKAQFRHTKFVANEAQFRNRIGDRVMDALEYEDLHHKDGETDLQAARVDKLRDNFFHQWVNVMASGYNEARNYRQGRVKEACFKWLTANNQNKLFPNEDLEIVMKRDFSAWEPKLDEDGKEVSDGDPETLAYYHSLMEFYVDELVPAVCSHHDFKPSVRHFVPLCDARYSATGDDSLDGQVIVTPGTEALILLFVKNARIKWESMYQWEVIDGKKDKKKYPFPKWSPKYPEKHIQWKTLYSDAASGQNPFGGWKIKGLKEYNRIMKMMTEVRKDIELCRYQDKLTMQRLYEIHKDDYEKEDTKQAAKKDDDDPDSLEMEFEDVTAF